MVKFVKWGSGKVSASVAKQLSSAGIKNPSSSSSGTGTNSDGTTYSYGSSDIAQKELAPVRSIDYVNKSGGGAGATTNSNRLRRRRSSGPTRSRRRACR